jgi:hypothetical protein
MVGSVQIKAQGLLNAAKWVEEEYGRDALATIIRSCSPAVRERYISAIAINWHPVEEFIEFVEKSDELLGRSNGKVAEAIGAAGARANMKGVVVRIAFYLAQPEFFFRRVAGLWRQFNDEGEMIVHHIDDRSSRTEIRGLKHPNAVFCNVLTGWVREIAVGLGTESPTARHTECLTRGDARCMWEARWAGIHPEERRSIEAHDSLARLPTRPPSGQTPAVSPVPPASVRNPSSGAFVAPSSGRMATSPVTGPTSVKMPSSASRLGRRDGGRDGEGEGKP